MFPLLLFPILAVWIFLERSYHLRRAAGRVEKLFETVRECLSGGGLTMVEIATMGHGKVDQRRHDKDDAQGRVVRAEYDQNGDGRPEQWEYFVAGQRQPYKVERDTTGDGKADTVSEQDKTSRSR